MSSPRPPKTIQELADLLSASESSESSGGSADGVPLPNGLETTEGLMEKYTAPDFTFGLELEFDFCVLKDKHKEWTDEENDPLKDPYLSLRRRKILEEQIAAKESLDTRTHTTDSQDHNLHDSVLKYLTCLLNYELPGQENMVSVLGEVLNGHPKKLTADNWHITYDDSLKPSRKTIEGTEVDDPDERKIKYRVTGAKLVSKVLEWEDEDTWMKMLGQLSRDLSPAKDDSWGFF
jgi:hypothetical protein